MQKPPYRLLLPGFLLLAGSSAATAADYLDEQRWLTFGAFLGIIAIALLITYAAAQRVRSAADFYVANRGVSGLQNGWAIAGDYLSAASFLGVAGLIALWGFDGFLYSVGWLLAYVSVLVLVAEPCRNIGKFTLTDILAYRNNPRATRIVGALSVITVSTFYLTAQMVGGGVLIKLLVGIDYEISVLLVGVVMIVYVLFGGMIATTWVQIVKAVLLVFASTVLVVLVWREYGFFGDFLAQVVADPKVQTRVAQLLGEPAASAEAAALGQRFLEPGLLLASPLDRVSLCMALVFGTAGLPHILMRFFTVPTAREARRSVVWAMAIIGGFYVMSLFLGLAAAIKVGAGPILAADAGGNMAAPLLAQYLGGGRDSLAGNLMLAFVAAVAFATILSVVAGLVLATASAIAHDLWVGVIKKGHASSTEQIRAARVSTLIVGAVAIAIGIGAKGQNVAHLVALAFAVAASANFPSVVMTLYWRRCNTAGVIAGMAVGTFATIALMLVSPNMTYPQLVRSEAQAVLAVEAGRRAAIVERLASADLGEQEAARRDALVLDRALAAARADLSRLPESGTSMVGLAEPLFPLRNPGIVSIPLGFLAVIVASLLYRDPRAEGMWDELSVRQSTGMLAARPVSG
jgi:cation/acetate symporter